MSSTSERGRWTPAAGDVLERLRLRQQTRLRFLHALYEAAEGSTSNGVRFKELGEQLGLTEEETSIVRRYLANEGLLSGATIVYIVITHQGVKEVEEALVAPAASTEHFPPAENVILIGTADGAVIQQGNTDSVQEMRAPPQRRYSPGRGAALAAAQAPIRRSGGRVCELYRRLGERNCTRRESDRVGASTQPADCSPSPTRRHQLDLFRPSRTRAGADLPRGSVDSLRSRRRGTST